MLRIERGFRPDAERVQRVLWRLIQLAQEAEDRNYAWRIKASIPVNETQTIAQASQLDNKGPVVYDKVSRSSSD